MNNTDLINEAAYLFKIFSDSTRLKILCILLNEELCVNQIVDKTQMTFSAISHQLKILKTAKLVKNRRDGVTIYYSLNDKHVFNIVSQVMEHVNEKEFTN